MAYPTDSSIRKLIVADIQSTLEAIGGSPTYVTTIGKVQQLGLNGLTLTTFPQAIIGPPSFKYTDTEWRKISVEMTMSILLVVRTSSSAVDAISDFFEDVSLALRTDVTRGGYALDTHVRGDTPAVPEISEPIYTTEVDVAISYRYQTDDPATAL